MTLWLPSSDQREIVSGIGDALSELLPLDRLHDETASDRYRLGELAELGVLGIAVDENRGGSGLGIVEESLIFEQLGYQLASPAVLASVLAAHALEDADDVVSGQAEVAMVTTSVSGQSLLVDAGHAPAHVLALGKDAASILADPISRDLDQDQNPWLIGMELVQRPLGNSAGATDKALAIRARLLIASQLTGMARRALDMAVEYAQFREQFGKPIGSFQAVKHHCADMAVGVLAARDLTAFAATAHEQGRRDAVFQIEAALSVALAAVKKNAAVNVQIHGGIGFSEECNVHIIVKQAQVWGLLAGGERAARQALLKQASPLNAGARHAPQTQGA